MCSVVALVAAKQQIVAIDFGSEETSAYYTSICYHGLYDGKGKRTFNGSAIFSEYPIAEVT